MNLEDVLKIGMWGACGFVFGESVFYAINGAEPFSRGFPIGECIQRASEGRGIIYYALGGAAVGTLAAMWHYDRWPKWVYDEDNLEDD